MWPDNCGRETLRCPIPGSILGLALALGLTAPPPAASASRVEPILPVTTYSVGEGLPSALVYQLAQDGEGLIWILNREGIVSFDGAVFRPQGIQQGLLTTQSGGLTVDHRGRAIVAALDGRIFRNEGGRWRLEAPAIDRPFAGQVLALAQASSQGRESFAVSTTAGLWKWDGSWRRVDRDEDGLSRGLVSLTRWGDELFAGTRLGLCRLGEALDCAWADDPRLREPILAVNSAVIGGRPGLLVLAPRWLGAITDGKLRLLGQPLDLDLSAELDPRNPPRTANAAINIDATGAVFFGTMYHGYLLEAGAAKARELGPLQGRPGEGGLTSIMADREGAIWIGTLRGLSRMGSRRFLSLDARAGLLEDEVSAIADLSGGRFVLGHNAGLTFLDEGGNRIVDSFALPELTEALARGIPPRVLDFAQDRSGVLWAAAGTALLEIGRDRRVSVHRFKERVVSVEIDPRGRLFVLCPRSLFVRRAGRFEALPSSFLQDTSQSGRWLATDGADRLYVASMGGLFWRDGVGAPQLTTEAVWHHAVSTDQKGDNVYAVRATPGGEALVGTSGGLYRLTGDRLEPAKGAETLRRPVYSLLSDSKGRLWAGTDDGVFVAEPGGYRQLSVRHGLAGRETNRGAGLVDSAGRVWIGTDQGLSIYREALDVRLSAPPKVGVQGLDIEGERRAPGETVHLPGRPRSVVFRAHTITFSNEDEVICRYRLDGLDEGWQGPAPLTTAGIRYTHLPPGRYRLRIAAAWRANGPWGEESLSQEIVVPTPWRERPAVWLASLLAMAALIVGGHRFRLRRLDRRNAELESFNAQLRESVAERQRLIAELEAKNSELERFTYTVSHDLKAPLVTIRGFTSLAEQDAGEGRMDQLRADLKRVHKAAETMGVLLNQLLDLSRIGRVVGTPQPVSLAPLIKDAAQRVPGLDGAQLSLAADLPTVEGDRARLLEVFENLLGNAVKFMGAQPAPRIDVSLRPGPEPVIVVSDNGIGIDPRFKERVFDLFERLDKGVAGTGIGLAVVKRIVEFHGGRIWVESTGVPGEGSKFCLTLPLSAGARPAD